MNDTNPIANPVSIPNADQVNPDPLNVSGDSCCSRGLRKLPRRDLPHLEINPVQNHSVIRSSPSTLYAFSPQPYWTTRQNIDLSQVGVIQQPVPYEQPPPQVQPVCPCYGGGQPLHPRQLVLAPLNRYRHWHPHRSRLHWPRHTGATSFLERVINWL